METLEQEAQDEMTSEEAAASEARIQLSGSQARRGEVISYIEAGLEDYGFGVAHVSAELACHHAVEAIHIRLMLEQWNEEDRVWDCINSQDFEWNAEDLPEGEELTYASISYNIPGCEEGELYRTKGLFGAWDEEYDDAWIGYSSGIRF